MARRQQEQQNSYWISYSDLMAGLLILFILISIFALLGFRDKEEALKDKKQEVLIKEKELKEMKKKVVQKEQELEKTRKEIEDMLKIKARIISFLKEELSKKSIKVDIDEETGAIAIEDTLLFDSAQSAIKPEGKAFLKKFFPAYVTILLSKKDIRNHIAEVIVEGHTDDVGSNIYNLKLSQDRALSVSNFLMKENFKYAYKKVLIKKLTAVGKGESCPIIVKKKVKNRMVKKINRDKSRRVEFKFRLNEEELLIKIEDMIKMTSKVKVNGK